MTLTLFCILIVSPATSYFVGKYKAKKGIFFNMKILVLNCGSSSLKYQLIEMSNETVLSKGNFERIGQGNSFLTHKVGENEYVFENSVANHTDAVKFVIEQLISETHGVIKNIEEIAGVGHRAVHGGEKFHSSVLINEDVIQEIKNCIPLAPLHNPAGLAGIEACKELMPNIKMVAVFDTAFHQTIPKEAYIYPIPYSLYKKYGIRKYGFHGTSHRYVSKRVAELMGKDIEDIKIVTCHLGQGASLCAVKNGKSVDTSMGLTPLAGVPMGTRSGDIDPSIITFLMEKENMSIKQIDNLLNKESGILGISEISSDFRDVENSATEGNKQAALALNIFSYTVAQYIAKYIVSMGGIDTIVFTAGIGERDPETRAKICEFLKCFGVELNNEKNKIKRKEIKISTENSKIAVYVVPTNEELMIARDTLELIK